MDFLQELFLTACMAVVFSLIVAASIAFSGGNEKASSVVKMDEKRLVKMEEKRLKVVGVKSKKKVKFVDDVMVRDVDGFDVEEKPSNDLNFLEKFDGFLGKSLEEEISRDEVNIVKMFDTLDYEGVDEEPEVIVSGSRIVEEIGNVKLTDVEEKACKGFQLIDEVSEEGIEDKKTGNAEVFESNHFRGNSQVGSGLEMLSAIEEMKRQEIDSITGLNMVDDDVSTNQKDVEEGGKDCLSAVLLGETSQRGAIEEWNQSTDINHSTDNGLNETEISAFNGGLQNIFIGENSGNQAIVSESQVERFSDSLLGNEEDGALCEESNVVASKEDLGTTCTVEEGTVRYDEFGKDKECGDEDDDDDWEGIERSELEKVFAKAVNYVEYGGKDKDDQLSNIGSNVQIQLYGLHRLAVEGPCYEPQPMALKVSARAKWNSWQKLGSMSPELAMEQYIKLLSEADSEWAYHPDAGDGKTTSGAVGGPDTSLTMPKELQADEEGGRSQDNVSEIRPTT